MILGRWTPMLVLAMLLAACAHVSTDSGPPAPAVQHAFAPTGRLRVGLLLGDATQAVRSADGQLKGIGFDLGAELARQLRVPFEPVLYKSIGTLLDSGAAQWDVAFIGYNAARAKDWDFAPAHAEVQFGFLVSAGSPLQEGTSEFDRPGIRIAVQQKSGPDAFLSQRVIHAIVVRVPTYSDAVTLLSSGRVDAVFSIQPILFGLAAEVPGAAVLKTTPGTVPQAMALPKGRDAGLEFARAFIERAKHDGTVAAAIDRAGLRGVKVTHN